MSRNETYGALCVDWIEAGHLLGEGVRLVLSNRTGGCSPPPYDTMNLSYRTGDRAANVRRNRETAARILGIENHRFVYLKQVHGTRVRMVSEADIPPSGSCRYDTFRETDGTFTVMAGVPLVVLTADCLPIALSDGRGGTVAMLHAGWRGTVGDIAGRALGMMKRDLRIMTEDVRAVIGPGIGSCCYRVDEGRAGVFVERYGEESGVVLKKGGLRLDLYRANRLNLLEAGVRSENIFRVGGCTYCDKRYYSYRREGDTGRQGSFVYLEWDKGKGA
ncbi:MAG: peptidoglycan editing factor PgeF [Actinomycetota bacterium]|nr:peptidoglycan editing factor PgeF [Actinomycetota bacterium]